MKKFIKVISKALIISAAFSAFSATADVLKDIQDRKLIRIAVPQDFPPFGSIGTDLKPQGIDIDMAN